MMKFSNKTENAIQEGITSLETDISKNIVEIALTTKSSAFLVREDSPEGQKRISEKASIINTFSDSSYRSKYFLCRK